ncbi:MAG TPA: aminoglycoside phosphotransferase family protein [Mycobacteriales bacterium]|nr:aminoglycoside phosphotransferase family protein [Mycobacteriales bacterium]
MSADPSRQLLSWAADTVGADVIAVDSLHGDAGPWLVRFAAGGNWRKAVLRATVGARANYPPHLPTGAAALRVAEEHGLKAPRLIAADLDGQAAGVPATLETVVPGSSTSPAVVSAERLRAAGAAIARAHQVVIAPSADLPLRVRSLQGPAELDEWALQRRWAALYRASPEDEKADVITAFAELTGMAASAARESVMSTRSTALLQRADDTLRKCSRPDGEIVLVHADLWAGNMVWEGDTGVTLIDWKDSGVGDPGVDLGHLRMQMATQYGVDAAAHILDGWQREMGREARHLPYWDVVAAVHTPTDLNDWAPGFDEHGRQVGSAVITARRDAFLRNALDQLDPKTE